MSRVYFQRAKRGERLVRGELVRQVQEMLEQRGASPGGADGIFGLDTENAVKAFQTRNALAADGKVTADLWQTLFGGESPDLFDRCLQLTADFEGHSYGKVVGNFDNAGLTWGIIGFTLLHGEIEKLLKQIKEEHPAIYAASLGDLADEIEAVFARGKAEQIAWADSVSTGRNRYGVEAKWQEAFERLGSYPEVKAMQRQRAYDAYWTRAVSDAQRFGVRTEMGLALCFDIAVQNGGIDHGGEEQRITYWIERHPGSEERDLRSRIAEVIADGSVPKYREDVLKRKLTLAEGRGTVHGAAYDLGDWALGEYPV